MTKEIFYEDPIPGHDEDYHDYLLEHEYNYEMDCLQRAQDIKSTQEALEPPHFREEL